MRVYEDFKVGIDEIARDLKEMGVMRKSDHFQNISTLEDDMDTFEITNYSYMITNPENYHLRLDPENTNYCRQEIVDRLFKNENPGRSWRHRRTIWEPFLTEGKFDYTYGERFNGEHKAFSQFLQGIRDDKQGRRHFLPVWWEEDGEYANQGKRVPCSIGYWVLLRDQQVHITYLQRSCDFVTHFKNDLYMTISLLEFIVNNINSNEIVKDTPDKSKLYRKGTFTHWIGSFHVFQKDVERVF